MKLAILSAVVFICTAAFAAVPLGGSCYGPVPLILAKLRPTARQALKNALAAFNYNRIRAIINARMSLFTPTQRTDIRQWLVDVAPPPAIVALMANTTRVEKGKLKRAIDTKDQATVVKMFGPKVMALNSTERTEVVEYFLKMTKACNGRSDSR
uniref:DUF4476 domain-containing protein n=1 Tax=Plectus sambesii TaxID=2011161 RepID=A0A914V1H9_9BILA